MVVSEINGIFGIFYLLTSMMTIWYGRIHLANQTIRALFFQSSDMDAYDHQISKKAYKDLDS